jgi:MIP family channel proteins
VKREAKPLLAELLGTYVVVLCAAGAGVATAKITGTPNAMVCGLASGTALAIVIVLTAGISGAHVNPALTLALAHLGRFPWRSVAGYVAAQMAGSAAAGLTVLWVLGSQASVGANTPNAAMGISQPFAFLLEVFLSFVMMMVILLGGELSGRNLVPGALRIGAVVGIEVMLFGPISGAAMNPARAFGPYLAMGDWTTAWIYGLGPVAGNMAAAWFSQLRVARKFGM